MRLSAFDTYALYLALKNHFTQDRYDFFKYHGKTNATKETFIGRRDRMQFQRLSRRCNDQHMQDYIVSNLLKGKTWVGELLDDDAEDIFKEYIKKKQSLAYTFTNDLDKAFSLVPPSELFRPKRSTYPPILEMELNGIVSIETFVLLDYYLSFSKKFDETLGDDDVIWSKVRMLSKKFYPFMEYDRDKMKGILKEKINEYK
jgi:hypothetical protein